jgi:hypothetical protein
MRRTGSLDRAGEDASRGTYQLNRPPHVREFGQHAHKNPDIKPTTTPPDDADQLNPRPSHPLTQHSSPARPQVVDPHTRPNQPGLAAPRPAPTVTTAPRDAGAQARPAPNPELRTQCPNPASPQHSNASSTSATVPPPSPPKRPPTPGPKPPTSSNGSTTSKSSSKTTSRSPPGGDYSPAGPSKRSFGRTTPHTPHPGTAERATAQLAPINANPPD